MTEGVAKKRCLLVDFENVQKMDLARLPDDFHVTIFVGSAQKSVPLEVVQGAQALGARLQWLKVDGNGSNALDFHIAYYLGCLYTESPQVRCYILSKDTGFDPLIKQLTEQGLRCGRITSLTQFAPQPCPPTEPNCQCVIDLTQPAPQPGSPIEPNYTRVIDWLKKMPKAARPHTKTALAKHMASSLPKALLAKDRKRILEQLLVEGKITETDETLTYTF